VRLELEKGIRTFPEDSGVGVVERELLPLLLVLRARTGGADVGINSVAGLIFGPRSAGPSGGVAMEVSFLGAEGAGLATGCFLVLAFTGAERGAAAAAGAGLVSSLGLASGGAGVFTCNDSEDFDIAVLRREIWGLAVLCLVSTLS
jgi:hypothetical protein